MTAIPPSPGLLAQRRLPIGAEPIAPGQIHFRVWAPARQRVEVMIDGADRPASLEREEGGYFSGLLDVGCGARYRFRLDGESALYPDPASRYQPEGPHGWSEIIDPSAFPWTDANWLGVRPQGRVLYEMHIG